MRAASSLFSLLGVLAVCPWTADALICFTCEGETSNWRCLVMKVCSKREQRCLTVGTVSRTGTDTKVLITKTCAERCPSEEELPDRALDSLFCCERSLCNVGPPK